MVTGRRLVSSREPTSAARAGGSGADPTRPPLGRLRDLARQVGNRAFRRALGAGSPSSSGTAAAERSADQTAARAMHSLESKGSDPARLGLRGADRAGGTPLPGSLRRRFERALGADLGTVRLHAGGAAAARAASMGARAFTSREDIHFAAGALQPDRPAGRRLLAHELAHVLQQRSGAVPAGTFQLEREETAAPAEPAAAQLILDDPADQGRWRRLVDRLVRAQFGLRGAGVTATRVSFVSPAEFERQMGASSSLHRHLFDIFVAEGADLTTRPGQILDFSREPYAVAGWTPSTISSLHRFIDAGIAAGQFQGQTREYDVTTRARFPAFQVAPGALAAEYIAGLTDVSGNRASRSITLTAPSWVHTLVHEVCHLYISDAFRDMALARADADEWIHNARVQQILIEGFAEHFTRQVMAAHPDELGGLSGQPYEDEVEVVGALVMTMGASAAADAYFRGDSAQLQRLERALDEYKRIHPDLLVPGFMIDAPPP